MTIDSREEVKKEKRMTDLVRSFEQISSEEKPSAGGKGGTLSGLFQAGYPVPEGFVVLPAAFDGDVLTPVGWTEVKGQLDHMRRVQNGMSAFAVRSSALSEDSVQASFAGEFETVLDVHTDEMLREAIHTVRRSRHAERVQAYSRAKGIDPVHDMAVVVQRLVRATISGVLFTADPVTGSHMRMTGTFVYGFGEELVSGEAEGFPFILERPKGRYDGPTALAPFVRKLFKLAQRLEKDLGCPQDIEWAVVEESRLGMPKRKLYLLQARPITTLVGWNPMTGEWNDSLTGELLWSRNNLGEARPDVMSPFTFSLSDKVWSEVSLLPGVSLAGNICGRYYANVSFSISALRATGKSLKAALEEQGGILGNVPEDLEIPQIPLSRKDLLLALPKMIRIGLRESQGKKRVPEFLQTNPQFCMDLRRRMQQTTSKADLISMWQQEIEPYVFDTLWILAGATQPLESKMKLKRELTDLVGEIDANALFSGLSSETYATTGAGLMASLGPVVGVARVAQGKMSRQEYLETYGHRGPHEAELSYSRPAEDPSWLDKQLEEYRTNPVDVDALLEKRRDEYKAAWKRLQKSHPKQAKKLQSQIEEVGPAARLREAARDEITRFLWVEREWALRAGELTGLGADDIFLLTLDEVMAILSGDASAVEYLPARRETYARYRALPPYPMVIRGRFDPFEWAADPERRSDFYDASSPIPVAVSDAITGHAGAAGRVEGVVRVLDGPEQSDQFRPGEILVAVTTNVGWTPLFPRAAAVVTDVGAPLSHAAIVARELGIPAVVGCGCATTRLRTGDRVRVDGGQGIVEILATEDR
jgi:phosphohistidine swiveling domain-containing protein